MQHSAHTHLESAVSRWLEKAEPDIEATMKQANIMPCGMVSPLGDRAGVQRNTKVYMEPSNSDCIAPSSAIFWSAHSSGCLRLAWQTRCTS